MQDVSSAFCASRGALSQRDFWCFFFFGRWMIYKTFWNLAEEMTKICAMCRGAKKIEAEFCDSQRTGRKQGKLQKAGHLCQGHPPKSILRRPYRAVNVFSTPTQAGLRATFTPVTEGFSDNPLPLDLAS